MLPSTNTSKSRAGEVQGAQAADRGRGKAGGSTEQDVGGAGEGLALTCKGSALTYQGLVLTCKGRLLHVRAEGGAGRGRRGEGAAGGSEEGGAGGRREEQEG